MFFRDCIGTQILMPLGANLSEDGSQDGAKMANLAPKMANLAPKITNLAPFWEPSWLV